MFRRRLIAVLSELESHEAQHFINTTLPEEPDSDDLVWPSDPEGQQITSEPDSSSPESWGIFGKPVRPAPGALFGGSEDPPPPRPQPAPRLPVPRLQPTPQPAPVPQQPAASSSSDPAPAYLRQAVPATTVTPAPPGPTQPSPSAAPDPVPLSAPTAAGVSGVPSEPCFPHMPARSPTVPPPPAVVDPPSGVRLRPRHPRRHGTRRSYPNGILCDRQCDNPACTALCPREDDPRRGTRHRHHACDDCHALGW